MSDELDLTPNPEGNEGPGSLRNSGSFRNRVIVGGLVLVLGFVLYQALTSARVFYYNVDEAIAQRDDLSDRTFRLQGTVVTEPVISDDGAITFIVAFGGEEVEVRHVGEEPSGLFELGIPVVAEGRWEGSVFVSRQLLVKHSEDYTEDNPDRVDYDVDETSPGTE